MTRVNADMPEDRTQLHISWAHSRPEVLRVHHARDAAALAGALPADVVETHVAAEGAFRGGLLYTPADCARNSAIVYFHGGGFLAGSPETHRAVTAWLARLSGMRVLSARYRLAPEHPFPAQGEDAVAAVGAAIAMIGADARIILAGDSAGACVALWGLRGLDPLQRRLVKGLVLLYGGYGLTDGTSIRQYGTAENGLDAETLSIMYRRVARIGGQDASSTWPLGFAGEITEPAYVLAAELDAVFDDSAVLFQRLRSSEKKFVLVRGQDHGFLKSTGKDPVAMRELEEAAKWIVARTRDQERPT